MKYIKMYYYLRKIKNAGDWITILNETKNS